jgi:hypothetical protein
LAPAENVLYSTSTEYDGNPSWEITTGVNNYGVDQQRIDISPGEVVTMSCAILTGGSASAGYGARIGLDFYGSQGRIGQANDVQDVNAEKPTNTNVDDVAYGSSSWTVVTWQFTVPSDYQSDGGGPYASGSMVPITQCIPWCGVWSNNGYAAAPVWFSDFQFYIS